ncbi:MAG: ArsR family transcriptional regulator [Erythrobacter sp.]|nr:MAG: ArsR family transcriptional regulator [Erythrobacter sp.]
MLTETILRALGDSSRLRILRLIHRMELAVGELAQVLGQSQPRVSQHVARLVDAGLAQRHREGSWVFLRPAQQGEPLHDAVARLLATAEAEDAAFGALAQADRARLETIRAARAAEADAYFARHAKDWDSLRAMLVPPAQVESALLAALAGEAIGQVLDIGTGTGRIAQLLRPLADSVTAFDKSPEMLRLARARLPASANESQGAAVTFEQGDFTALPFPAASFDTVALHHVLHYAQHPEAALAEAARVCRPGGRILIADLAAHDREELRSRHAHTRLGFGEEALAKALAQAGFVPAPPVKVPGGEIATIIWTGSRQPAAPSTARIAGTA